MTLKVCAICGQAMDQPKRGYRITHDGLCRATQNAVLAVRRQVKSIATGGTMSMTDDARATLRGELEDLMRMLS